MCMPGTPTEHCCGPDSCPGCNRTGRCTPAAASRGDPRQQFGVRERLEGYLLQKEQDLLQDPLLAQWKRRVGRLMDPNRPHAPAPPNKRAKRSGAAAAARGRGRGAVGARRAAG